jgi:predicted RNase H-like HicB family nuclease
MTSLKAPGTASSNKPVGSETMRYAVVIEKSESNFSAYVPDLPGCIATGATVAEVESEIREAIAFHLEGMREDGLSPPSRKVK